MPSKNPAQRLADIIENVEAVQSFTTGFTIDSFRADRRTVYAVTRALEIISEVSRRLPTDLLVRHPEIDWPVSPPPEMCSATSTIPSTRP